MYWAFSQDLLEMDNPYSDPLILELNDDIERIETLSRIFRTIHCDDLLVHLPEVSAVILLESEAYSDIQEVLRTAERKRHRLWIQYSDTCTTTELSPFQCRCENCHLLRCNCMDADDEVELNLIALSKIRFKIRLLNDIRASISYRCGVSDYFDMCSD